MKSCQNTVSSFKHLKDLAMHDISLISDSATIPYNIFTSYTSNLKKEINKEQKCNLSAISWDLIWDDMGPLSLLL